MGNKKIRADVKMRSKSESRSSRSSRKTLLGRMVVSTAHIPTGGECEALTHIEICLPKQ